MTRERAEAQESLEMRCCSSSFLPFARGCLCSRRGPAGKPQALYNQALPAECFASSPCDPAHHPGHFRARVHHRADHNFKLSLQVEDSLTAFVALTRFSESPFPWVHFGRGDQEFRCSGTRPPLGAYGGHFGGPLRQLERSLGHIGGAGQRFAGWLNL